MDDKYREGDRIIEEVFARSDSSIDLHYLIAQLLILLLLLSLIQFPRRRRRRRRCLFLLMKRQYENHALRETSPVRVLTMARVSSVPPGHLFISSTICARHQCQTKFTKEEMEA